MGLKDEYRSYTGINGINNVDNNYYTTRCRQMALVARVLHCGIYIDAGSAAAADDNGQVLPMPPTYVGRREMGNLFRGQWCITISCIWNCEAVNYEAGADGLPHHHLLHADDVYRSEPHSHSISLPAAVSLPSSSTQFLSQSDSGVKEVLLSQDKVYLSQDKVYI